MYGPTPLEQVLLDVSRVEMGPDRKDAFRERVSEGLDWEALLQAASWHGVGSLLFLHLRDVAAPVPAPVLERLQDRFRSTARRNLYLTVELNRILGALAAAGIQAMPFKGPVAAAHYGNPALRAFSDVDVVVDRTDVRAAIQILQDFDFRAWSADVEAILRDSRQYALPFDRSDGAMCVDLHWGFAWGWFGRTLDFDQLWAEGQQLVLAGASARVFSPGHQLLHMGMHGSKHGPVPWAKLKWIVDMGELMRSHRAEAFAELPSRAEAVGAGRILAFSTALVRDLLQAPVPPVLDRHLDANPQVLSQLRWVADGLWTHGHGDTDLGPELRFNLMLRERRLDRWRYSWRRITTPGQRDRAAFHLPRPLHFLYPVLRLGRLGVRYANPRRLSRVIKRS